MISVQHNAILLFSFVAIVVSSSVISSAIMSNESQGTANERMDRMTHLKQKQQRALRHGYVLKHTQRIVEISDVENSIERDADSSDLTTDSSSEKNYAWNDEDKFFIGNTNGSMYRGNGLYSLNLVFSVWFPYHNSNSTTESEENFWKSLEDDSNNTIRQAIIDSLIEVLCHRNGFVVVNSNYSFSNNVSTAMNRPDLAGDYNINSICPSSFGDNNDNSNQVIKTRVHEKYFSNDSRSDTAIWNRPDITMTRLTENVKNSNATVYHNRTIFAANNEENENNLGEVTLVWSRWLISFPILHIGNTYLESMISNQPISNVADDIVIKDATINMNEVTQLDFDVALLDYELDRVLQNNLVYLAQRNYFSSNSIQSKTPASEVMMNNSLVAYTSPIEMEWDMFYPIYDAIFSSSNTVTSMTNGSTNTTNNNLPPFAPGKWYDVRIVGVMLFLFTILSVVSLTFLSQRRRDAVNKRMHLLEESLSKTEYQNNNNKDMPTIKNKTNNDRLSIIMSVADESCSGWLSSHDAVNEMLDQSSTIFRSLNNVTKDSLRNIVSMDATMTTETSEGTVPSGSEDGGSDNPKRSS